MTKNKDSTRYYSSNQESYIAKILNGRVRANSGATLFSKGDVVNEKASFLIECKTCVKDKESFSIKKEWLIKNKEEAFANRLSNSCIAFNFGPDQDNYFIINEKLMKFLIEKIEEDEI